MSSNLLAQLGLAAVKSTGSITLAANVTAGDTITLPQVGGGEAQEIFEFDDATAAATGSISLADVAHDGDTITIDDGVSPATTFEFDTGVVPTGSINLTSNPIDGKTITINDGTQAATVFEFDEGTHATGTIALTGEPADGNIITIADGVNTPVVFEFDHGVKATGALEFADNASDGDILVLNDGTNDPTTFEFTDTVAADGHVPVIIGLDAAATMAALVVAINGVIGGLLITATASTPADDECTLENNYAGVRGNQAITCTVTNFTANAMTGGLDPGDGPVTGTNTPVAVSLSDTLTMGNLITAINSKAAVLKVTATGADPADATCTLACSLFNALGGITRTGAAITVTGMDNGKAPGSGAVVGGHVAVAIGATAKDTADNLFTAINGVVAGLLITATKTVPASSTLTLANSVAGIAGNIPITSTHVGITIVGMTGGGYSGYTFDHIPVLANTSATVCMANLLAAINAQVGLAVTATPSTPADGACTLTNDATGTQGNVAMAKAGTGAAHITLVGMTGGTDVGDAVGAGNRAVAMGATMAETGENLKRALDTYAKGYTIKSWTPSTGVFLLEATLPGVAGNVSVAKSGDQITVTGMTGGLDDADLRAMLADIHAIAENTAPA